MADTHALAWYLTGSAKISKAARQVFDDGLAGAHEVLIPAIVLAELIMIAEKRRIALNLTNLVTRLNSIPTYRMTALTPQTVLRIHSLTQLPDIHDRLIVAAALEAGATIITRDQMIRRTHLAPVVW